MSRVDDWADYLDPDIDNPDLDGTDAEFLDRVNALLGSPDTWDDGPSPRVKEGLFAQIAAEKAAANGGSGAATEVADVPEPAPAQVEAEAPAEPTRTAPVVGLDAARKRRRSRWTAGLGAVAAAAAVLAAVVLWPRGDDLPTFGVNGTTLAAKATATAEIDRKSAGVAITLHIKGLPPAQPGTYYAAWVEGPRGIVAIGTFHWRKGGIPILLWSGVDPSDYPDLFVTVQKEGGDPGPSDQVVMRGTFG